MKIAIDCRQFGNSGIGTFIKNIVENIITNSQYNFLLIGKKKELAYYTQYNNVEIQECNIKPFSFKEIFFFPTKQVNHCDAFFTPYINIPLGIRVPIFSTIHDVIFFDLKELVSPLGRFARWIFYKNSCRKSKLIFTVSQFSKERITHHFKPSVPIKIVYNGIAKSIKEYATVDVNKKDFILYVGNIKPHKGLKTLIGAYQQIKEKGLTYKLVIVGEYQNFKTTDNEFLQILQSYREDIIFTGRLSDTKLIETIKEAQVLVLPSHYEGFGIPPLEALYLGTDTIISDIPPLKEIYKGLPVTFFKTGDIKDLVQKLMNYHPNTPLDFDSAKKIINKKYNFKVTANKILETIRTNL